VQVTVQGKHRFQIFHTNLASNLQIYFYGKEKVIPKMTNQQDKDSERASHFLVRLKANIKDGSKEFMQSSK